MSVETWRRAQKLQVASEQEGAFIGRFDDFQFDLDTRRIYGWRVKGQGVFGKAGGVRADDVLLLGRDIALVRSEAAVEWTDAKANAAEGRAWASAYEGTQAITRRGAALGAVLDFVVDRAGKEVTGLILHGNRLLPFDENVTAGPAAIVVENPDAVVALPEHSDDEKGPWWDRIKGRLGAKKGAEGEEKGEEE